MLSKTLEDGLTKYAVGAKLRARMPFLEPVASPAPEPVAG